MIPPNKSIATPRYAVVPSQKAGGATYTPKILADFVARKIIESISEFPIGRPLRVLDPAIGDGELLISLLNHLAGHPNLEIHVHGFETDSAALSTAAERLALQFPATPVSLHAEDFLEFALEHYGSGADRLPFEPSPPETYDIIIANPPYVRTQIMGARQSQLITGQFGLAGRVDLYFAFIIAMAEVLNPKGVAGIIVSNRFMTTRSGAPVRRALLERCNLRHIWDLGDTKLFEAAVLPAVLIANGKTTRKSNPPTFTSIYETNQKPEVEVPTPIRALSHAGIIQVDDGRQFLVQHGTLDTGGRSEGIWRIASEATDLWLSTVQTHTWRTFGDIGPIRVGVKTCADKVFIQSDWHALPEAECPELLRPLITHHTVSRFRPIVSEQPLRILYPHESVMGRRRTIDISLYPRSQAYLERHCATLVRRKYVIEAGRKWYEIWVPQDPAAWDKIKLVFRDIAKEPTFCIDQAGSVVNGDCYWIMCPNPEQSDLLWLAVAVGNSRFIERFYDTRFHNKLYAGRRRFITQYVEQFPLPDPHIATGKAIIRKAKEIYACTPSPHATALQDELERMVWKAFGLPAEKGIG